MSSPQSSLAGHRFRSHIALAFAAVFALATLSACATTPEATATNPMRQDPAVSEEIEILVRNHNFSQATVYTARGGASQRLGIVPGKGEATFKTRWPLPDIQLRVKFLAGPDILTETLPVGPGELLELILPAR